MRYSRGNRASRGRRLAVGVVVVAFVAAVGGGGWYWYSLRSRAVSPRANAVAATRTPEPTHTPAKPSPRPESYRLASDEQTAQVAPAPAPAMRLAGTQPALRPLPTQPVVRPETSQPAPLPATQPASQPTSAPSTGGPLNTPTDPTASRATSDTRTGNAAIEDARRLHTAGKLLEARERLNTLLKGRLSEAEEGEVRALLARIADETVFSPRVDPNDPLVASYTVQPGDVLIHIGRKFDVPAEALMVVNRISNPRALRADQKIKVLRGPFHARIYKSKFRLDVYLGDVFVRSYRVGLGAENGTPEGVWRVKERLENPTYYPSPSAADKRIIAADDPNNPLGEHWIGLEGIDGEARGREGYGIHGTIEPESIGKAVSLGCIRMHNEDVAFLYKLMLPGKSTVTVLP